MRFTGRAFWKSLKWKTLTSAAFHSWGEQREWEERITIDGWQHHRDGMRKINKDDQCDPRNMRRNMMCNGECCFFPYKQTSETSALLIYLCAVIYFNISALQRLNKWEIKSAADADNVEVKQKPFSYQPARGKHSLFMQDNLFLLLAETCQAKRPLVMAEDPF